MVHSHSKHRILTHKIQKIGVTVVVTPISYSVEPVIAASKYLSYRGGSEWSGFLLL